MTEAEKQFLFLLKTHVNNENLPDGYQFDVGRVFSLAKIHNVLPMVFDSAVKTGENVSAFRNSMVRSVGHQVMKNTAFKVLYDDLMKQGLDVIVVKGPVCADCYYKPDYRLSSDFDVVVSQGDSEKIDKYLLEKGFEKKGDAYINNSDGLYIEVSTQLGEGSGAIKTLADEVFEGFEERLCEIASYRTLGFTDNFVYLIYHAFKHFVGSGFGIRQLIDIMLFAEKYKNEIYFEKAVSMLRYIGAYSFACNVFYCIENVFEYEFSGFDYKSDISVLCLEEFVTDLLSAGVFGKSSEDRLHSATIVSSAVSGEKGSGLLRTVFPSYSVMRGKYQCLRFLPFLLPLFWFVRLADYLIKSFGKKKSVSPSKSIEIAHSRLELMKKMGIIEQQTE